MVTRLKWWVEVDVQAKVVGGGGDPTQVVGGGGDPTIVVGGGGDPT